MRRKKATNLLFSIAAIYATDFWPIKAQANTPEERPEEKKRPIKTEVTLGLPFLSFFTKTSKGPSSSQSFYGYSIDAAFCPNNNTCGILSTHSHIDIKSGRRALEGADIGLRHYVLGQVDEQMNDSSLYIAQQQSSLRSFVGFSLSQRDFDFRTVIKEEENIPKSNSANTEGAFWSLGVHTGFDVLLMRSYRVGANLQYYASISASTASFSISQILLDLRLLQINF